MTSHKPKKRYNLKQIKERILVSLEISKDQEHKRQGEGNMTSGNWRHPLSGFCPIFTCMFFFVFCEVALSTLDNSLPTKPSSQLPYSL